MTLRKFYRLLATLGIMAVAIGLSNRFISDQPAAEVYPGKSIKIIVPFKPGGGSDRIARTVNAFTEAEFGRSFIFQYKPGGGGHLGVGYLSKSRPDGYMIATYNTPDLALGPLTGTGQYDLDDLSIIGQIAFDPNVFATLVNSPYADMTAFMADAKARPGKIRLGIAQPKGGTHLSTLAMLDQQNIDVSVVLFAGGSELATAVLGGQVDVGISGLTPFLGSMERVKFLATTGEARHPKIPNTKTMNELGIPMNSGIGRVFLAPSGIDSAKLERLRRGFRKIYATEAFKVEMRKIGNEPVWLDGEQVKANLAEFSESAARMIKKYGL